MEKFIYEGFGYSVEVSEEAILVRQSGRKLAKLLPTTCVKTVTENNNGEFEEHNDTDEKITGFAPLADGTYRWTSESRFWTKEYILECDPEGFRTP